ncbi:MAG: transcription antitermination factor NusB [Verrucomicrobiales bacterium]|nr:transcription antitermination factor NusB [Verrucomicrobiales bacterium]
MRLRRVAREKALQFLFQHEVNPTEDLGAELNVFWEEQWHAMREERGDPPLPEGEAPPAPTTDEAALRTFAEGLIHGTLQHLRDIDAELSRVMINWSLHRLAAVDRNILRMAVYEFRYRNDIPPVVTINEAIDIARKFSTADSGKFVNGILDRIKGELNRPAREASEQ